MIKNKLNNNGFGLINMLMYLSIFFVALMLVSLIVTRFNQSTSISENYQDDEQKTIEDNNK